MLETTVRARLLMAGLYQLGRHDDNVLEAVRDLKGADFVLNLPSNSLVDAVLISWAGSGDVLADLGELVRIARHRDGSTAAIVASTDAMEALNLAIDIDGPTFRPMLRSLGYDPESVQFGHHPAAAVDRDALVSAPAGDSSQPSDAAVPKPLTLADVLTFLESREWTRNDPAGNEFVAPGSGEVYSWAAALEIELDPSAALELRANPKKRNPKKSKTPRRKQAGKGK
jgi:hypothetical protein